MSASSANDVDLKARLCAGREGCRVRERRAVPGDDQVEIVDLALSRGSTNEECNEGGGEYWLVRRGGPVSVQRIAVDCDHQTESDGLAHAETRVDGSDLVVAYEELRGGDRCEGVDARFHLSPFHLVKEVRYDGAHAKHHCQRENEIATDWDASDHLARFGLSDCELKPNWSFKPAEGAAIPKFSIDETNEPAAVGSCGVLVDAARAARWMRSATIVPDVRLRAMVVNDRLLIDVEGAITGSISVIAVAGWEDNNHGGLGCASEARPVSVTTLRLDDGRIAWKGPEAPFLKVSGREGSTVHLATETIASTRRLGVSYESLRHEKLDSAFLPHSASTAREIPPIYGPFKASERCQLVAGRLDVRSDNASMDPGLELQYHPWKGQ